MKNNTKIRLHLSKQLFESLTREVLKESKKDMSGGTYTEAVKAPSKKVTAGERVPTKKKPGSTAAEKHTPEIKKANAMRKIKESLPVPNMKEDLASDALPALLGLIIPGVAISAALAKDLYMYMKKNNLKGIEGLKQAYKNVGKSASKGIEASKPELPINETRKGKK